MVEGAVLERDRLGLALRIASLEADRAGLIIDWVLPAMAVPNNPPQGGAKASPFWCRT